MQGTLSLGLAVSELAGICFPPVHRWLFFPFGGGLPCRINDHPKPNQRKKQNNQPKRRTAKPSQTTLTTDRPVFFPSTCVLGTHWKSRPLSLKLPAFRYVWFPFAEAFRESAASDPLLPMISHGHFSGPNSGDCWCSRNRLELLFFGDFWLCTPLGVPYDATCCLVSCLAFRTHRSLEARRKVTGERYLPGETAAHPGRSSE